MLWNAVGALLLTVSSGVTSGAAGMPAMVPPPMMDPIEINRIAPAPPPPEVALHRALGMRDTPYVAGGADPSTGFDCSGLAQWAYAQSGTDLSHSSRGQWSETQRIAKPRPGDLVFFDTYGGVSHVGINIDGKTFIHAVGEGQAVEITSYDEPYWADHLIGFGRVSY